MSAADKAEFYSKLAALESEFAVMKPEVELSVYDRDTNIEGHVVVWNTFADTGSPLGRCGKGGTRITPNITLQEVRMLARIMALKNAAAGLPFGGAKSGLKADPDSPDFERQYRTFVSLVKPILRENGGRFGGFGFDIGARPIHPVWACDELKSMKSFTGKPVDMGGTDYDNEGIAGLGVVAAIDSLIKFQKGSIARTHAAIQGLGAMGAAVFRYYTELGGAVDYVSDLALGATYDLRQGVPTELLESIIRRDLAETKIFLEKNNYPKLDFDAVLYQDVDILFPCAVQEVISKENAPRIKAKYISEGANNPASEEARTLLFKRGVTTIPDFIANPGGIIAAYVEMSSDVTPAENARTRANVKRAKELTKAKISENVENLLRFAGPLDVELSHAGKFLALSRILGHDPKGEKILKIQNL